MLDREELWLLEAFDFVMECRWSSKFCVDMYEAAAAAISGFEFVCRDFL